MREELKAATQVATGSSKEKAYEELVKVYAATAPLPAVSVAGATGFGGSFVYSMPAKPKYETRTEELGVQSIEGVEAIGTRTVTTIPAGDIGNERPIEMVYEKGIRTICRWWACQKHSDTVREDLADDQTSQRPEPPLSSPLDPR